MSLGTANAQLYKCHFASQIGWQATYYETIFLQLVAAHLDVAVFSKIVKHLAKKVFTNMVGIPLVERGEGKKEDNCEDACKEGEGNVGEYKSKLEEEKE